MESAARKTSMTVQKADGDVPVLKKKELRSSYKRNPLANGTDNSNCIDTVNMELKKTAKKNTVVLSKTLTINPGQSLLSMKKENDEDVFLDSHTNLMLTESQNCAVPLNSSDHEITNKIKIEGAGASLTSLISSLAQRSTEFGINMDDELFVVDADTIPMKDSGVVSQDSLDHSGTSASLDSSLLDWECDENEDGMGKEGCVTIDGINFRTFEPYDRKIKLENVEGNVFESDSVFETTIDDNCSNPEQDDRSLENKSSNRKSPELLQRPEDNSTSTMDTGTSTIDTDTSSSIIPSKTTDLTKIKGWRHKLFALNDSFAELSNKSGPIEYDETFIKSADIKIEENPIVDTYENESMSHVFSFLQEDPLEHTPKPVEHVVPVRRGRPLQSTKNVKYQDGIIWTAPRPLGAPLPVPSGKPKTKAEYRRMLLKEHQVALETKRNTPINIKPKIRVEYHPQADPKKCQETELNIHANVSSNLKPSLKTKIIPKMKSNMRTLSQLDSNYMYVWMEGRPIRISGSKGIKKIIPSSTAASNGSKQELRQRNQTPIPVPEVKTKEISSSSKTKSPYCIEKLDFKSTNPTNTKVQTPVTVFGIGVYPSINKPLQTSAIQQLKLLRNDRTDIDDDWIKFAVSVVTTSRTTLPTPKKVVLPVTISTTSEGQPCYRPAKLTTPKKYIPCFSDGWDDGIKEDKETAKNSENSLNIESILKNVDFSNIPDSDKLTLPSDIVSVVKEMLIEMVDCTVNRDSLDSIVQIDPSIYVMEQQESNSSCTPKDVKSLKSPPRKKGSLLSNELRRLNVTMIVEDETPVDSGSTTGTIVCSNEYCRLGCVCQSLERRHFVGAKHCGKLECMFECTCKQQPISQDTVVNQQFLSEGTVTKINESLKNLAKKEKEFQQTVVRAKNDVIIVEGCNVPVSGRRRREIKLPERYRNDNFLSNKEFDMAESMENEQFQPVSGCKPNLKDKVQKTVATSARYTPNHAKSRIEKLRNLSPDSVKAMQHYTKKFKLRDLYVLMYKAVGLDNILIFCLFHQTYGCNCLKVNSELVQECTALLVSTASTVSSTASLGPSIVPTHGRPVQRNVAVKRTASLRYLHNLERFCARSYGSHIDYRRRNKCPTYHPVLRKRQNQALSDESYVVSPPQVNDTNLLPVLSDENNTVPSTLSEVIPDSRVVENSVIDNTTVNRCHSPRAYASSQDNSDSVQQVKTNTLPSLSTSRTVPIQRKIGPHSLQTSEPAKGDDFSTIFPVLGENSLLCHEALPDDELSTNVSSVSKDTGRQKDIVPHAAVIQSQPPVHDVGLCKLIQWRVLQEGFLNGSLQMWITSQNCRLLVTRNNVEPKTVCHNLRNFRTDSVQDFPPLVASLLNVKSPPLSVSLTRFERYGIMRQVGMDWEVCGLKLLPKGTNPGQPIKFQLRNAVLQVPLPRVPSPCRWFIIHLDSSFDKLVCKGCTVTYTQIQLLTQAAVLQNKVNILLMKKNFPSKYKVADVPPYFGFYSAPKLPLKVFLGPFGLAHEDCVTMYKEKTTNVGGVQMKKHYDVVEKGGKNKACWLYAEGADDSTNVLPPSTVPVPVIDLIEEMPNVSELDASGQTMNVGGVHMKKHYDVVEKGGKDKACWSVAEGLLNDSTNMLPSTVPVPVIDLIEDVPNVSELDASGQTTTSSQSLSFEDELILRINGKLQAAKKLTHTSSTASKLLRRVKPNFAAQKSEHSALKPMDVATFTPLPSTYVGMESKTPETPSSCVEVVDISPKQLSQHDGIAEVKFIPSIVSIGYITGCQLPNGRFLIEKFDGLNHDGSFENVEAVNSWLVRYFSKKMIFIPKKLDLKWHPKILEAQYPRCRPLDLSILDGKHVLTIHGVTTLEKYTLAKNQLGILKRTSEMLENKQKRRQEIKDGARNLKKLLGIGKEQPKKVILSRAIEEIHNVQSIEKQLREEKTLLKNHKLELVKNLDEEIKKAGDRALSLQLLSSVREILTSTGKTNIDISEEMVDIISDSDDELLSEDEYFFEDDETEPVVDLTDSPDCGRNNSDLNMSVKIKQREVGLSTVKVGSSMNSKEPIEMLTEGMRRGMKRSLANAEFHRRNKRRALANQLVIPMLDLTADEGEENSRVVKTVCLDSDMVVPNWEDGPISNNRTISESIVGAPVIATSTGVTPSSVATSPTVSRATQSMTSIVNNVLPNLPTTKLYQLDVATNVPVVNKPCKNTKSLPNLLWDTSVSSAAPDQVTSFLVGQLKQSVVTSIPSSKHSSSQIGQAHNTPASDLITSIIKNNKTGNTLSNSQEEKLRGPNPVNVSAAAATSTPFLRANLGEGVKTNTVTTQIMPPKIQKSHFILMEPTIQHAKGLVRQHLPVGVRPPRLTRVSLNPSGGNIIRLQMVPRTASTCGQPVNLFRYHKNRLVPITLPVSTAPSPSTSLVPTLQSVTLPNSTAASAAKVECVTSVPTVNTMFQSSPRLNVLTVPPSISITSDEISSAVPQGLPPDTNNVSTPKTPIIKMFFQSDPK